jgi:tRNA pseudouridine38-40 synthase
LLTKRIKLVVGYDGTDFSGWAAQKDRRTVQRTLTEFVRQVSGDACEIVGASRTDSGAHAKGQVCHFDTTSPIEPRKWAQVLNQLLPKDLSILRSEQVDRKFHARFSADWRHYRYRITHVRDPLAMRTAHWYWKKLDAKLMHETGQILIGSRDFRAFSEELEPNQSSIRELQSLTVRAVRHDEANLWRTN